MTNVRSRYENRIAELRGPGNGAPGPDAGQVLVAAGDLLRRSRAIPVDLKMVDEALARLPSPAVTTWVDEIEVRPVVAALGRAADDAVEVALAETASEKRAWLDSALAALHRRDSLESAVAALTRSGAHPRALEALSLKLQAIDKRSGDRIRRLTGLNEARRAERDLLDPPGRSRATWFSARSECDGLVQALSGDPPKGPGWAGHLRTCVDCSGDLAGSRMVDVPPGRHVSADELLRYEIGPMSGVERGRIDRHADSCFPCAQTLMALADGERAIVEAAEE